MTRVVRWARSPRTAIALILLMGVYAAAMTAVPQAALSPEAHAEWIASGAATARVLSALGFDRAFTNPLFLLLAGALAFSTGVCAFDRSTRAVRLWRARGRVDERLAERLRAARPVATFSDPDAARAAVERIAADAGLSCRTGRTAVFAERGALGLAGSPVFHWSLVGLMLVVSLGFLMRWEGLIGVPEGVRTPEAAASYGKLDAGPLAQRHTGYTLSLSNVTEDYRVNGVAYGFVPTVEVRDGERLLASSRVHANRPLRAGPLLIHLADHGLAATFELRDPDGRAIDSTTRIFDFDESTESGTSSSGFDVSGVASITVEMDARDARGNVPRLLPPAAPVIVTAETADGRIERRVTTVGGSVDLGEGWSLLVTDAGYYARLSVVRDWSVAWIYALLVLATVALVLAILVPYRSVWIRVGEPGGAGVEVAVAAMSGREGSRLAEWFAERLGEAATREVAGRIEDGGDIGHG